MTFKHIFLASFVFGAVALTSCKEEGAVNETDSETDAMLLHTSPASPGANSAQPATVLTPAAGQAPTGATQGSVQAGKTAAGMNPPHGAPGHRCDIEVGAPLNSPPKANASMPVQMQQPTAPATTTITTSSTGAPAGAATGKMNPPHGEPGHDCKVPVGAPLGS